MMSIATNPVQAAARALPDAPSPSEMHDDASSAQPSLSANSEPSSTAAALATFVPTGGLHPVADKPPTELFGFIFDKVREAMHDPTRGGQCGAACEGMKVLVNDQGKLHGDPSDTTPI